MKNILLFFALAVTALTNAQNINFPGDYAGTWKGTLEIYGTSGIRTVPMELQIAATENTSRWIWKTTYDNKDVRDYELVVVDAAKGKYQIDENNGILLDLQLFGNKSFSCFEVQGYQLYNSYTFSKDTIIFEITTSTINQAIKSGNGTEESPTVTSYPQTGYQKAILSKT